MPVLPVKFYSSEQPGAPVLSGTAGAMLAILQSCLVDGFGLKTCDGITVSAGVATATFSTGHSFLPGSPALIAGATPAGLNGEWRVLTAVPNSITFAAPGVPDGAATGTMTAKVAPAGWLQPYTGTNLGVFKSGSAEATGLCLRLDDTGNTTCRVVGYESMTGVSAGLGAFPLPAQVSGGLWWGKSNAANATARPWRLYASARAVHLWVSPSATVTDQVTGMLFTFGDTLSYRSGDAYGCLITGGTTAGDVGTSIVTFAGCLGYGNGSTSPAQAFIARAPLAVGGSLNVRKISAANSTARYSGEAGYSANVFPYPNAADNALRLAPLELHQNSYGLLGKVAGVHHCAQALGESFSTGAEVAGEGVYAGKTLTALRVGPVAGGTVFIDAAGPWEV